MVCTFSVESSSEPFVGARFSYQPGFAANPPDPLRQPQIKFQYIGLDARQRCPIGHIHIFDMKNVSRPPLQSHDGNTDGIGASRGSRGKHPLILVVEKRFCLQRMALSQMKMINEHNVREALQVF
jgi:hypothetical protein